ncbi:MAG TPA: hypothetical protein VIR33_03490 [Thermopolyspora sp.]|jgi:hypothetical protein
MKLINRIVQENRERVETGYAPAPLLVRLWWWLIVDVMHIQPYQRYLGHHLIRWYLTEPLEVWATWTGRFQCRVLGRHNDSCRGRMDHWPWPSG